MLVFEAKLQGKDEQYCALDEAIRTARFVRNKCLRYWMDNQGVGKYDLNKYCAELAKEFEEANKLNSMARQASAERAWSAISRFYAQCFGGSTPPENMRDNCKKQVPGKKGFPQFRKHRTHGSVEYKT